MNLWLKDFNKQLLIAGFKNVKLKDIDMFLNASKKESRVDCVQFFDASLVAGWEHLRFAALNALNAFKGKVNISSSLAMETLLYASAQRRIEEAVKLMGIKPRTSRVAVLILADTKENASKILRAVAHLIGGKRDDSVTNLTEDKITDVARLFKISKAELGSKTTCKGMKQQALIDLVIEHMALLVTQR